MQKLFRKNVIMIPLSQERPTKPHVLKQYNFLSRNH